MKKISNSTTDYHTLKEFFVNDKCLPIIEFFLINSNEYYTRAELTEMTTIDKGTLNRYLPILSRSKYNILNCEKHTFEGRRNNTTIYALNKKSKYNLILQRFVDEIKAVNNSVKNTK